jgi:hypothetical protein
MFLCEPPPSGAPHVDKATGEWTASRDTKGSLGNTCLLVFNSGPRTWLFPGLSINSKGTKELIKKDLGHEIVSVDDAYDFCLTRVHGHFEKRDIFVATSDLSRSFVAMCFLVLIPAAKIAFWELGPPLKGL